MPAQRKVFRIEHLLPQAAPLAVAMPAMTEPMGAHEQKEILAELKALRALMALRADTDAIAPADLAKLRVESDGLRRTLDRARSELASLHAAGRGDGERAVRELGAVAAGAEHATQQILDAAEAIEDAAGTLAASVKRKQAQTLAQEIQEQATRIFEACNFQDLGGQRIGKVLATLATVNDHVARMMEICDGRGSNTRHAGPLPSTGTQMHGPRLSGDVGHATQAEIDRLLAAAD